MKTLIEKAILYPKTRRKSGDFVCVFRAEKDRSLLLWIKDVSTGVRYEIISYVTNGNKRTFFPYGIKKWGNFYPLRKMVFQSEIDFLIDMADVANMVLSEISN